MAESIIDEVVNKLLNKVAEKVLKNILKWSMYEALEWTLCFYCNKTVIFDVCNFESNM
jgi:hypothetical protein